MHPTPRRELLRPQSSQSEVCLIQNIQRVGLTSTSKDYIIEIEGGRKFFLNVCRGVVTDAWNTGVDESDGDIAGLVRRDHGDFAIG